MHSLPSGRLERSRRKQFLLFGLSVLLPALVLFVFIVLLNRQDIELRKTRAVEAQQQKAEEIGQYLAQRLEAEEKTILQELASDPDIGQSIYRTHPRLVFVGRIVKKELLMPWEGDEVQKRPSETDRSGELVLLAQEAEFERNDLRSAKSYKVTLCYFSLIGQPMEHKWLSF
jgi:hypothetical protein